MYRLTRLVLHNQSSLHEWGIQLREDVHRSLIDVSEGITIDVTLPRTGRSKSWKGYERSDVWSKLPFPAAGVPERTNVSSPPIGGGQSSYKDSFLQGYSDDDNDCGPSINSVKEVLYL